MSKRLGIWAVRWPLSTALGWCRRTAGRYWRFAAPTMDSRQENQFEIAQLQQQPTVSATFYFGRVELKILKTLNIGERIRIFATIFLVEESLRRNSNCFILE
jgi:hypothetical protein